MKREFKVLTETEQNIISFRHVIADLKGDQVFLSQTLGYLEERLAELEGRKPVTEAVNATVRIPLTPGEKEPEGVPLRPPNRCYACGASPARYCTYDGPPLIKRRSTIKGRYWCNKHAVAMATSEAVLVWKLDREVEKVGIDPCEYPHLLPLCLVGIGPRYGYLCNSPAGKLRCNLPVGHDGDHLSSDAHSGIRWPSG